jgi:hypothetical protein
VFAGAFVVAAALVMASVAASIFVMTAVSPPVYWLGAICFWGYLPAFSIGVAVLVTGIALSR